MDRKIKALMEAERDVAKNELAWLFFWTVILLIVGLYLGIAKHKQDNLEVEGFSEFSDQGGEVG